MKKVFLLSLVLLFSVSNVGADTYKIYWPQENLADPENDPNDTSWQAVQITNTSSNTVIDGSMSGVYEQDFSALINEATRLNNNEFIYDVYFSLEGVGQAPTVLDFSGNTLKFRAENAIDLFAEGPGEAYTYDVVYEINPTTGELLSTKLIASTEAEANLATNAGYSLDREFSTLDRSGIAGTFQSYAANITNEGDANIVTKGGLVTKQLSNPDGSSIIRKEDDGSIHIGENSVIIVDAPNSSSGNDMIYSSAVDGSTLQIGNIDSHKTIIKGTLEVTGESSFQGVIDMKGNRITGLGAPQGQNDAISKGYLDNVTNHLADGIEDSNAMSAALAALPNTAPDAESYCGGGLGSYGESHAFSLGCASNINDNLTVNFGASKLASGGASIGNREFDDYSLKAGFIYKIGYKSSKSGKTNTTTLEKELYRQQASLRSIAEKENYKDAKIAEYEIRLAKLEKMKSIEAAKYESRLARLEEQRAIEAAEYKHKFTKLGEQLEALKIAMMAGNNNFASLAK